MKSIGSRTALATTSVVLAMISAMALTACSSEKVEAGSASSAQGYGAPVANVNSANFEKEVLNSQKPVVVDFYATWCGPCKMMAPVIDSAAGKYKGAVKFVRVDIDQSPDLAARYGIEAVPTVDIFSQGKVLKSTLGLTPAEQLNATIESVL